MAAVVDFCLGGVDLVELCKLSPRDIVDEVRSHQRGELRNFWERFFRMVERGFLPSSAYQQMSYARQFEEFKNLLMVGVARPTVLREFERRGRSSWEKLDPDVKMRHVLCVSIEIGIGEACNGLYSFRCDLEDMVRARPSAFKAWVGGLSRKMDLLTIDEMLCLFWLAGHNRGNNGEEFVIWRGTVDELYLAEDVCEKLIVLPKLVDERPDDHEPEREERPSSPVACVRSF